MVYLSEKAYVSINWSVRIWEKISILENVNEEGQHPDVTLEDTEKKNVSLRWDVGYIQYKLIFRWAYLIGVLSLNWWIFMCVFMFQVWLSIYLSQFLKPDRVFSALVWYPTMQRRSRGINAGLILLLSQIFHVGISNIPPVTLATLVLNIWFFLNPLKPLFESCLSVEKCYQQKDWQRLLLSPLHHADDWHLYFNMASMLWKGIHLERRLGSRWFAYVIVTFSLLTGVLYLFLEFALAEFLDEPDFRRNCAVGFSGKADRSLREHAWRW